MAKKFERTIRFGMTWASPEALTIFAFLVIEMGRRGYVLPIDQQITALNSIQSNIEVYEGRGVYNDNESLREYIRLYVESGHTGKLPDALLYFDQFEQVHNCPSDVCKCRAVG